MRTVDNFTHCKPTLWLPGGIVGISSTMLEGLSYSRSYSLRLSVRVAPPVGQSHTADDKKAPSHNGGELFQ